MACQNFLMSSKKAEITDVLAGCSTAVKRMKKPVVIWCSYYHLNLKHIRLVIVNDLSHVFTICTFR